MDFQLLSQIGALLLFSSPAYASPPLEVYSGHAFFTLDPPVEVELRRGLPKEVQKSGNRFQIDLMAVPAVRADGIVGVQGDGRKADAVTRKIYQSIKNFYQDTLDSNGNPYMVDAANDSTYLMIHSSKEPPFWVKVIWLTDESKERFLYDEWKFRRPGGSSTAKKTWEKRDAYGVPPEPKPVSVYQNLALYSVKPALSVSVLPQFPHADRVAPGKSYPVEAIGYRVREANPPKGYTIRGTDGKRYYRSLHTASQHYVLIKNENDKPEIINISWLSDSSAKSIRSRTEDFEPTDPNHFKATWEHSRIDYGLPPLEWANSISQPLQFPYEMLPFENEFRVMNSVVFDKCPDFGKSQILIRTSQQFQAFRSRFEKCERPIEIPRYEFNEKRNTLLGMLTRGGCGTSFRRRLTRDEKEKKVTYTIRHETHYCMSGPAAMSLNLVLVPKIPENYDVKIEESVDVLPGIVEVLDPSK